MFENFPYTDMHQLNLDWIIKIIKDFLDNYAHIQELIANGEESLTNLTEQSLSDIQEKADNVISLLDAWYNTHSEDIANKLTLAILDFTTTANQRAAAAIASIPSDYSEFYAEMHNTNLVWQGYLLSTDDAVDLKMGIYGISNNAHPAHLPEDFPTPGTGIIIALDKAFSQTVATLYFCIHPNGDDYWFYNGYKWFKVASTSFVIDYLNPILANIGSDKYREDYQFSFTTQSHSFLDGDGINTLTGDYDDWLVTSAFSVNPATMYMITASARYTDHDFFQFLDADMNIIYRETNPNNLINRINKKLVISPANAKYARIATIDGTGTVDMTTVEPAQLNPCWRGKKWACIGDSITEPNERSSINYVGYIKQNTDIEVVNLAHGGTGFKRTYAGEGPWLNDVDDIPLDSDIVTIFCSGNDSIYEIGTPTDTGTTTLCGAINTTIAAIFDRLPTCNLGIITPIPWESFNPADHTNWMYLFSQAIVQICENWGIPCLNLYHCSNLRPWNATFREYAYTHDDGNGVHPDETGHKLFAPRIQAFMNSMLFG